MIKTPSLLFASLFAFVACASSQPATSSAPAPASESASAEPKAPEPVAETAPAPAPAPEPEPAAPEPAPAPAPAPTAAKPAKPAPKPAPAPAVAAYTGPNPCTHAVGGKGLIDQACARGGIKEAKAVMKDMVKKAKKQGLKMDCDNCHKDETDWAQFTPEAKQKFKELLKIYES